MSASLLARALADLMGAALALGHDRDIVHRSFRLLVDRCAWPERRETDPLLPSGVSHRWPYGLSVVCGAGARELRAFIEAQAESGDARAYWDVGMAMTEWIGGEPETDISRFLRVAPLFVPDERAPLRMWHSVRWLPGVAHPRYHVYVSARARADREPAEVLESALVRLGLARPFAQVRRALGDRGAFTLLSMELRAPPSSADQGAGDEEARTKVYVLLTGSGWPDIAPLWSLSGQPDDGARAFVDAAAPPFDRKAWLCGLTLDSERVVRVALHAGLAPEGRPTVEACARAVGVGLAPYHTLLRAQSRHHFVSYQLRAEKPRLTVYTAPDERS